jgi:hypothetical protein
LRPEASGTSRVTQPGGSVKTILIIAVVVLVVLFLLGKFRGGKKRI